ncbi:RNA polymerase sigma factor SigF [Streptomyces sp. NPDC050504]|uniref:RNA polymerase sigma factor SigF n=1 Tax=Streptomyces sp. NPDC050504 TaxID=3365618 RepID=UPI0037A8B1B5
MPTHPKSKHPHDDAPDTADAFRRLAVLPAGPERDALRGEIASVWLPMADRLAGRFRNRGEAMEDLKQVAALGLVKAVDRYDPQHGSAFESFAVPTITGEIKRHFRDHLWTVHVPRRVQDLRGRVRAARQELAQTASGHPPTLAEIAARAGITEEEATAGLEALDSYSALSLDAELPGADDGYSLQDALGAPDPALDTVVDRESVKPGLRALPEREKRILYMRFFRDMTQSRIAEDLGISQMHVSRLISRCCTRLRDQALREQAVRDRAVRDRAVRDRAPRDQQQRRTSRPTHGRRVPEAA